MTDFSQDTVTRAIEEKHEKYMANEQHRKLAIIALDWLIENDPKWAKIIIVNAQEKYAWAFASNVSSALPL